MRTDPFKSVRLIAVAALVMSVAACRSEPVDGNYLARVGDEYLYPDDIEMAMTTLPGMEDSASATAQIVNQWVTNSLLAMEARNIGLDDDPHVRKLLSESEKSVLVSSLMNRIYSEQGETVSEAEVRSYFELNKSRLKTVEPYVLVRYLASPDRETAREARRQLQRAMRGSQVDSLWLDIIVENAADVPGSQLLSSHYFPESRLFTNYSELQDLLPRLSVGQISSVVEAGGAFHFIQVADRVPAGSEPRFNWVDTELTRQLTLQKRKEALARKVQELRTIALSRNLLEVK